MPSVNSSGIPPRQLNNLSYIGSTLSLLPVITLMKNPTTSDRNFPIMTFAINGDTGDTDYGAIWYLQKFEGVTGSEPNAIWIKLSGTSSGPLVSINVDANSAPGTDPVLPTAAGQITITGAQVATGGVGTNVIRSDSLAANTFTIEIQRTTTSATTNVALNGVSHFNSDDFSVDANGFVSLDSKGLDWNVVSTNQLMLSNNGYICVSAGGALTMALPAASALGDFIEVTLDGATSFQITQAAGQQIRYGNLQTTSGAGGSITTTAAGDTIRMVCQTANLKWNVLSSIGALSVV